MPIQNIYAPKKPQTGVNLIAKERERHTWEEGWSADWDNQHKEGELAKAAAMYAIPNTKRRDVFSFLWPWELKWWKPSSDNRIKELAKAGALIAAEIDRLIRLQEKEPDQFFDGVENEVRIDNNLER